MENASMISILCILLLLSTNTQLANSFLSVNVANSILHQKCGLQPRLFMADHSSVTTLSVGDTVTVVEDVLKAGENLRGLSGTVIETWEKCDVDPTCCCAEFVDENLAVHVRFNITKDDTFVHYFAEAELARIRGEDESCVPPL